MYGYVVVTGDKGLCGAYNHNIVKLAEQEIAKHKNTCLFVIGSMGRAYFEARGMNVDTEFLYTAQDPAMYRARRIQETITDMFLKKRIDEIHVIYTKLEKSQEIPQMLKLFPLEREHFEERRVADEMRHSTAVFEPSPEAVMDNLVPNYVKGLIFGILTEAFCSEQNARMTAMDSATGSARDMIAELTLDYNRARQAAITQEITEIASGARSQKNK